jgi:hypothetical protein
MFLPYAVEDNIERKKNWVKCCLKWKFKYYKQGKRAIWQLNSTLFPQRVKNDKNIYNWIINDKKKKNVVHFYFLQNQDLSTEMRYLFVNC